MVKVVSRHTCTCLTADTTVSATIVTPANPTTALTPSYGVTDHRVGKRIVCPVGYKYRAR